MLSKYDLLIIGATFTGMGAAFAKKENTLVVERCSLIGYEFIDCFNPGYGYGCTLLTGFAKNFADELTAAKLLTKEGITNIAATAPILYSLVKDSSIPVMLNTDVAEVTHNGVEFSVKIFNSQGFSEIRADMILDTRSCNVVSKTINAVLNSDKPDFSCFTNSGSVSYICCPLTGSTILKLCVDKNDDFPVARKKLHGFWEKRKGILKEWTISSVANCFDYNCRPAVSEKDGAILLPSCAYRNPLEALQAGINSISRMEK
ncbi:MAG: hypothetical protein M0R40_03065 [Firmicutes bacterium]|nr:hypothetical protein [Bacillota bacterium]